jgi:hypothetical protein
LENAYLLYVKVKTGEKIRRGPFPRADMERMISIGAELMADYGPPEKCDQIVLLSVLEPAPEGRPGESLEIEARSLSREIVDKMLEISKERKRRKNDRSSTKGMAPS